MEMLIIPLWTSDQSVVDKHLGVTLEPVSWTINFMADSTLALQQPYGRAADGRVAQACTSVSSFVCLAISGFYSWTQDHARSRGSTRKRSPTDLPLQGHAGSLTGHRWLYLVRTSRYQDCLDSNHSNTSGSSAANLASINECRYSWYILWHQPTDAYIGLAVLLLA